MLEANIILVTSWVNIAVKYNVLFRLFCRITKRFWYYSTVLLHDFGITQPYYYTILVLLNRITTRFWYYSTVLLHAFGITQSYYYTILVLLNRITAHYCVVGLHFSVHKNREREREGERESYFYSVTDK